MKPNKTSPALESLFAKIAQEHLDIDTLETRGRDRLDFHDLHVAGIVKALQAAYDAGFRDASQVHVAKGTKR